MGFWGLTLHLANFLALPVVLAAVLSAALVGVRGLALSGPKARRWLRLWAWLFAAGLAVMLAGLWWFGRDGKMVTYAVCVLVTGSLASWLRGRHG